MAGNQSTLVRKYADGATRGKASAMFVDGDGLYSYGHHFPLAIRRTDRRTVWYLLNGDRYSVRMYPDAEAAKHGDGFNPPDGAITGQETWSDGQIRRFWHRIGSVALRENGHDYLCSMDEGSYFVSQ